MTQFKIEAAAMLAFICAAACTPPTEQPADAPTSPSDFADWAGTYEIVAVRRASDVAAPAMTEEDSEDPIGNTITITEAGLKLEGISCDEWTAEPEVGPNPIETDPILSDLYLPSLDGATPALRPTLRVMCEGELVFHLFASDHRVIALPWHNSSHYLIAEKPLSPAQVSRLQNVLTDMKFGDLEPTGILDTATLQTIRSYYEYRLEDAEGYIFARPAISESLLEKLQVLDE